MTPQLVQLKKRDEAIAVLTLNRPEKRNALNIELMEELCQTFEELQRDTYIRVVIIQGSGSVFCAGLDLVEAIDPLLEERSSRLIARLFSMVYSSPLVTIAAVNGAAIGGGAGILSVCDFAIATKQAKIGFLEARRGLVAAQVAVFLSRQMDRRKIRELLLLGDLVEADQALSMGLINRMVNEEELMSQAFLMASSVLKGAPQAIKETKRLLEALEPARFSDDLDIALSFHHASRRSDEAKEGAAAFLEKRDPNWTKEVSQGLG